MLQLQRNIRNWFIGDSLDSATNLNDHARARLIFDICLIVVIVFSVSALFLFSFGVEGTAIGALGGALTALTTLFLLKAFDKVEIPILFFILLMFTGMTLNLFLNRHQPHFIDPLWAGSHVVFTVVTSGIRWGMAIFTGHLVSICYYLLFYAREHFEWIAQQPEKVYYGTMMELSSALVVLLYVVYAQHRITKETEQILQNRNEDLGKQASLIKKQHEEKAVMLKEIHHRVKNNLQVINSLLNLQAGELEDDAARRTFESAQNRVHAMSLIHAQMYKSEDLSEIESAHHIKSLTEGLIDQYSTSHNITTDISIDVDAIEQKSIVPLGLIINELVSNTLKHGISNEGKISIALYYDGEKVIFNYADDGKGFDPSKQEGFGLELIEILTEQLDGEYSVKSEEGNGVSFSFIFPRSR